MKLQRLVEESQFFKTREEVEAWLKMMEIKNYTINDDLIVDVANSVSIGNKKISLLPVQFGKVGEDFICNYNLLASLKGAPKEVGGNFMCDHNQLASLQGAPREVGGDFNCSYNKFKEEPDRPHINIGGMFVWKI